MQFGTGAASAEIARAAIGFPAQSPSAGCGFQSLRQPLFVKKGERLAVRMSTSYATSSDDVAISWEEV